MSINRLRENLWTQEISLKKKKTLWHVVLRYIILKSWKRSFLSCSPSPLSCKAICGLLVAYVRVSDALKFKPTNVLVKDLSMLITFEEPPAFINSVGQQE